MECGNCTLCCELLPIQALNKPHSEKCKYCETNCTIYEDRPDDCKNFNCLWVETDQSDESLRPNNTHVIFEKIPNVKAYLALVDPKYPLAYKTQEVESICIDLLDRGFSVLLSSFSNEPKRLRTPKGIKVDTMIEQIMKEL